MEQNQTLVSKVLVLEGEPMVGGVLKVFFLENHLIGLRATASNIFDILESNIDLGAILISEDPIADGVNSLALSKKIHHSRPDLPIFLRRFEKETLDDIPYEYRDIFTGAFCVSQLQALKNLVQDHLFADFYPPELVSGIQLVARDCIEANFKEISIEQEPPFLVHDNIMREFNSLIALESKWCRGYLMLQVSEGSVGDYISNGKTSIPATGVASKDCSELITHLTNEIWGAINRKFIGYDNKVDENALRIQVPIYINPDERYVSFGTTKPQLCYHFRIADEHQNFSGLEITLKLVFNLGWSPENFELAEQAVEEFIESGELELF